MLLETQQSAENGLCSFKRVAGSACWRGSRIGQVQARWAHLARAKLLLGLALVRAERAPRCSVRHARVDAGHVRDAVQGIVQQVGEVVEKRFQEVRQDLTPARQQAVPDTALRHSLQSTPFESMLQLWRLQCTHLYPQACKEMAPLRSTIAMNASGIWQYRS